MIPKNKQYYWFGIGLKSQFIENGLFSIKKNLPNYKTKNWYEKDLNSVPFIKQTYGLGKCIFVAYFLRFIALY